MSRQLFLTVFLTFPEVYYSTVKLLRKLSFGVYYYFSDFSVLMNYWRIFPKGRHVAVHGVMGSQTRLGDWTAGPVSWGQGLKFSFLVGWRYGYTLCGQAGLWSCVQHLLTTWLWANRFIALSSLFSFGTYQRRLWAFSERVDTKSLVHWKYFIE